MLTSLLLSYSPLQMAPKLTNPLRPVARYRKGQAPAHAVASDSDSDEEQGEQDEQVKAEESEEDQKPSIRASTSTGGAGRINVALRQVEVDSHGQVKVGGKEEVGRTAQEQGASSSEYGQSLELSLARLGELTPGLNTYRNRQRG